MAPDSMDVVSPDGGLWIRRQVFEHSASSATLLSSPTAADIDFPALARALGTASVLPSTHPPAVPYSTYTEILLSHAHLPDTATTDLIVEALETNAPAAFVRCNDPEKLAPGRQVDYRGLLVPVPELIAFMLLHVAAANASRYRETADSVWPAGGGDDDPVGTAVATANVSIGGDGEGNGDAAEGADSAAAHPMELLQQQKQQQQQQHMSSPTTAGSPARAAIAQGIPPPSSPPRTLSGAPADMLSLNLSPLRAPEVGLRKKPGSPSPANTVPALNGTSAIVASVSHSLQKETHLVASNIAALLLAIAACYGDGGSGGFSNGALGMEKGVDDDDDDDDDVENIDHRKAIREAEAKLKGRASMQKEDVGMVSDETVGVRVVQGGKALGNGAEGVSSVSLLSEDRKDSPLISRTMFENLSFLLTTAASADRQHHQPITSIVPEWRDACSMDAVPLARVVELTTTALTTMSADPSSGPIDTAEIRNLERKTIIRRSLPVTSVDPTDFPHGKEVRITDCADSTVYLLCSLGRVSLLSCNDCTLFVGSCVSISTINCNRVRVHAIARVFRVTNCFDSELYVCTNRRPQIVGGCRGINFAPYNGIYPCIQRELAAVGVDPSRNAWNQFYRPATSHDRSSPTSTTPEDLELTPAIVTELPPAKFMPFVVPVRPEDCDENAVSFCPPGESPHEESQVGGAALPILFSFGIPLPLEYAKVIDERRKAIESLTREINSLPADVKTGGVGGESGADDQMTDLPASPERTPGNVTPPSGLSSPPSHLLSLPLSVREQAKQAIEERFRAWLISSGNMRHFSDLVRLGSPEAMEGTPPPSTDQPDA